MSGTLIKTFNVGDRVIKTYKSGTSKIGYKAETENPIPLDPASNWIVAEKDGDVQCCGPVSVDEITDMPDGSTVELFTDEELFYAKTQTLAVPFQSGMQVPVSKLISHAGSIYKVIQAHLTQADWTPDIVPALFLKIQAPGQSGYPAWVQPTGSHDAYQMGDKVTFNDKNYESKINANVWSPIVYPASWMEI